MDNFAYKRNIILETDRKKIILKIEGAFQNDSLGTRVLCALSVIEVFFTVVLWEKKEKKWHVSGTAAKKGKAEILANAVGVV